MTCRSTCPRNWSKFSSVPPTCCIERIISHGHASPTDFWYHQTAARVGHSLEGGGEVAVRGSDGRDELGDFINIPAPRSIGSNGRRRTSRPCGWACVMGRPHDATAAVVVFKMSRPATGGISTIAQLRECPRRVEVRTAFHSGRLVLQLHRWEIEHHHGRIGDPADLPTGNGSSLWFT